MLIEICEQVITEQILNKQYKSFLLVDETTNKSCHVLVYQL